MQPLAFVFPVLFALFLWWFSTGLVIVVYDRARWLAQAGFAGATVALCIALAGIVIAGQQTDLASVYLSVACGMLIWSWQVAGYFLGFVTGPKSVPTQTSHTPTLAHRFRLALRASLHHELLAVAGAIFLLALTWGYPNRWGVWMYIALWLMHASAKLTVFFGVRNFHIDFLPQHLRHLGVLLTRRPYNAFFMVSVVLASSVVLALIYQAILPATSAADTTGLILIATMMALGVLEHLLLVLPVPATLYGWGIRAIPADASAPPVRRVSAAIIEQSIEGNPQ